MLSPTVVAPATPTPLEEIAEAIDNIGPLHGLPLEDRLWLARHGQEYIANPGDILFEEGAPAEHMVLILKGEIHVRRQHGGPMALFIGRTGQMTGLLPFSRMKGYGGQGFAVSPVWTLLIHRSVFPEMLAAIPSMAQRVVSTLLDRVREVTRIEQQAEKLAALGQLAGNLAHELNNPASAAQRAAATLLSALRANRSNRIKLITLRLTEEQMEKVVAWEEKIFSPHRRNTRPARRNQRTRLYCAAKNRFAPGSTASAAATHGKWRPKWPSRASPRPISTNCARFSAPASVASSCSTSLAICAPRAQPKPSLTPLRASSTSSAPSRTTPTWTAPRFSKSTCRPAWTPRCKCCARGWRTLRSSATTSPDLPRISAYGGELNQVWTALIENALDALGRPKAGLRVRSARLEADMLLVEIWDTGPGIPPELQERIFEPFFTTKAPGTGARPWPRQRHAHRAQASRPLEREVRAGFDLLPRAPAARQLQAY